MTGNNNVMVNGFCPMGCGMTLVLSPLSLVVMCREELCEDPYAAHSLLSEDMTDHIVVFDDDSFTVKHPLRERIHDELFECDVFDRVRRMDISGYESDVEYQCTLDGDKTILVEMEL